VPGAEFYQGGGEDGALKVEVEFGLGEAADKGLDRGHTLSLTGGVGRDRGG